MDAKVDTKKLMRFSRITVPLLEDEHWALLELSIREGRDMRNQARILIRSALGLDKKPTRQQEQSDDDGA